MIRDVDLVAYLPQFMQNYKEIVAALESENPEFQTIWKAADRVLYNRFIATADEYGISRFEKLLGIQASDEDTLESRRSRVQNRWLNTIPYTMKVLVQKLTTFCGDAGFNISDDFNTGYTLALETHLELYGQVEELCDMLCYMLPANIALNLKNTMHVSMDGKPYIGMSIHTSPGRAVLNHTTKKVAPVQQQTAAASTLTSPQRTILNHTDLTPTSILGQNHTSTGVLSNPHITIENTAASESTNINETTTMAAVAVTGTGIIILNGNHTDTAAITASGHTASGAASYSDITI